MENVQGVCPTFFLGIAEHVQGDAIGKGLLGAHAIDRFLHLTVATVPPFHGVGGRGEQFIIEKRQRLLQVGRAQLVKRPEVLYRRTRWRNWASLAKAVSVRHRRSNTR